MSLSFRQLFLYRRERNLNLKVANFLYSRVEDIVSPTWVCCQLLRRALAAVSVSVQHKMVISVDAGRNILKFALASYFAQALIISD